MKGYVYLLIEIRCDVGMFQNILSAFKNLHLNCLKMKKKKKKKKIKQKKKKKKKKKGTKTNQKWKKTNKQTKKDDSGSTDSFNH